MKKTNYKKLLKRLAEYHGARVVDEDRDEIRDRGGYVGLRFLCGNDVMTWDQVEKDPHGRFHPTRDAKPIKTAKGFLEEYINQHLFVKRNTYEWSQEFNEFGLKIISAKSLAELEVKLDILGY